jgi:hypothetical protein
LTAKPINYIAGKFHKPTAMYRPVVSQSKSVAIRFSQPLAGFLSEDKAVEGRFHRLLVHTLESPVVLTQAFVKSIYLAGKLFFDQRR